MYIFPIWGVPGQGILDYILGRGGPVAVGGVPGRDPWNMCVKIAKCVGNHLQFSLLNKVSRAETFYLKHGAQFAAQNK